ncbi:MAG: flagellar hook-associated protein FlgL [Reinekea sp.]|jgi:flagellar hook-associated protein 3 FlgL
MVDRVSTYWIYNRPINDMLKLQAQLNRTQEQVSSGVGMLTPADDPVGAARVLQLDQEISQISQYERNVTLIESRLTSEESVLDGVTTVLQRVRELTVKAGNAAILTTEDRRSIGQEIEQRVDELYDLMNSKDGSGEYIFAGFRGNHQPFIENIGGGFSYQGDEGVRYLKVSSTITLASSDSGKEVFLDIPANEPSFFTYGNNQNTGNGYISAGITADQEALNEFFPENAVITFNNELDIDPASPNFTVRRKSDGHVIEGFENIPFQVGATISVAGMSVTIAGNPNPGDQFIIETSGKQSILTTTEKLNYALSNYTDAPEYSEIYDHAIFNTLENIDFAIDNISQIQSRIGSRLNITETTLEQHADNKLAAQDIRADIRDLDYAEAVSRLQMEQFVLQAAQQSFAAVTQTSLFDFIR